MLWYIGVIMLTVGLLLLVVSLILVFALRIPELLDELSGRKAKRQIKHLKELNIGTGSLEGVATEDFYNSLSSGNMISEEYEIRSEVAKQVTSEILSKEENKKEDISVEDIDKTQFIEEDEVPTGFVEDEEDKATGLLVEDEPEKNVIQLLEEQSSL